MSARGDADPHALIGDGAPDRAFSFTPHPHRVQAVVGGVPVADSERAMVLRENRLDPVWYFPREHVRMDLMRRSAHRTWCPFKGYASYFSLHLDGREVRNLAWSYEQPIEQARAIAGHVAFYRELVDAWLDDAQPAADGTGRVETHGANPLLGWLIHDAPAAAGALELTRALAERMLAAGIALWRLHIVIRTLHPQLMAVVYRWWRKHDGVEEIFVPYEMLRSPQFLNSPLVPLYEGAGGIRRRLEGPGALLDYPILADLRAEGGTDYVAMPMPFSDGQINAVTIASARPGGFATQDLGHVYEILAVLGRLYEVHALRYRATTLLDTYLGRHAGARVLDGRITRGDGEDIEAVIWFCDLRESTPLAQSMSRTEYLGVLNAFFDCMAGAVIEHDGQVLRFIGDAALAIFPITPAAEPHAVPAAYANALAAALDAGARIDALNAGRTARGWAPLHFGIALHPGEVTYGNIGTASRLEFTVIGDAANRAARIEAMCRTLGRSVLVSAPFARHFPGRFESLGAHRLRGVDEALELFALRG